jgi:DNA-binding NarL/FixJ family response regulator
LEAQSDFKLVAEATTGADAILKVKELQPDVIILDMSLPDMDGLHVAKMVKGIAPSAEILVVSAFCSDPAQAFLDDARGFLLKSNCGRELVTAVRTVSRSEFYGSASRPPIRRR